MGLRLTWLSVTWSHINRLFPLFVVSTVANTVGQLSRLMLRGGSGSASQPSFFVQDTVISILEQVPHSLLSPCLPLILPFLSYI